MKNLATGGTIKQKGGGGGSGSGESSLPYREPDVNTGVDTGATSDALQETNPCIPFNSDMTARASLSLSDDACRANECSGGCCRVYHWLICDTANEMPNLACICNENTQLPPTTAPVPVTPAPVIPVTPAPTIPVTSAPIPVATVIPATSDPVIPATSTPIPVATTDSAVPTGQAIIDISNPSPVPSNPVTEFTKPFEGGAPSDACASGSTLHSNPQFKDFIPCFQSGDCSRTNECCIHSFCFCGTPDSWEGDCVARTTDVQK
jgi:hypothetical protein